MNTRCYRGHARIDAPDPGQRGIAYGDGVFETMRVHRGAVHWWPRHRARLAQGASRLRLALPDAAFIEARIAECVDGIEDGVLKLVVSRGAGGRGYAPVPDAPPDWQLALHPLPDPGPETGLALRWCETRLSVQPLLAGIKHCNRLEQVLARAEWPALAAHVGTADEGLMRDADGAVTCAIAANLFVLRDGRWTTPLLDRCGIAGVLRGWALEALEAIEARLMPADVLAADAVFLCNAVRGILPVARLDDRRWAPHPRLAQARQRLAAAHPAFATEPS